LVSRSHPGANPGHRSVCCDETTTRLEAIWTAADDDIPTINPEHRTITWKDGSGIAFEEQGWDARV